MPKLLIEPADDNPRWLGDLRVEQHPDSSTISFIAQSSRGHDKYEWQIDTQSLLRFLGLTTDV